MTVTTLTALSAGSSSSASSSADGLATGEPTTSESAAILNNSISDIIDSNSSNSSSTSSSASSTFLSGAPVPPPPPPPLSCCAPSPAALASSRNSNSSSGTSPSLVSSSSSSLATPSCPSRDPRVIPGCSNRQSQQVHLPSNISTHSVSTKVPELASVRINSKPKSLQNSKITSRITILNTTGSQQAVAPVLSPAAKNYSFLKSRVYNSSVSLPVGAQNTSSSPNSAILLSKSNLESTGKSEPSAVVNELLPKLHHHHHHHHQHHHEQHQPHHQHHLHLHHHHLHHHHPHHTTLRHVTSSTPYSLLSANSAVSYSISEEDEDEGFNEEAASSSSSSSSSSSNVDLNVSNSSTVYTPGALQPEQADPPKLLAEPSCTDSSAAVNTETSLSVLRSSEQEGDPAEDDDQLPSIAHLTVSHQHPDSKNTLGDFQQEQEQEALHFEPLALSIPCCDTASSFQAMLHGSDDDDEEVATSAFVSTNSQNGYPNDNTLSSLIIKGPTGSVRGKRNIVRKSINNYTQLVKQANLEKGKQERDFCKEEKHKCVLYLTTLGIVRKTFDESKQIKAILKNSFIDFDERDVYINEEFKKELRQRMNRLPNKNSQSFVIGFKVPVLFVNGHMLGGFVEIEKLNESGQLLQLLDRYRRANRLSALGVDLDADDVSICSRSSSDSAPSSSASSLRSSSTNGYQNHHPLYQADCARCGGTRFVNCDKCFGSRKTYIHHFDYASVSLKCSHCKKSGLIRCSECLDA